VKKTNQFNLGRMANASYICIPLVKPGVVLEKSITNFWKLFYQKFADITQNS